MNLKALLSITLVCLLGSLQTLFAQNIGSEIKDGKKYIKHKVQAKETVFKIAQTYKVSQEDLIDVNPEIANTLKKDAIILIPTKEEVKKEELVKDNTTPNNLQSPNADSEFEMVENKYTVKKGESLTKIAKIHKVEIEDIKKWNELSNDIIKPGQELIVGISTRKTNKKNNESKNSLAVNSKTVDKNAKKNLKSSAEDELLNVEEKTVEHKVEKGESLAALKKKYGVSMQAIKDFNKLTSDELSIGQIIKIPAKGQAQTTETTDDNGLTRGKTDKKTENLKSNNSDPFNPGNTGTVTDPFNTNKTVTTVSGYHGQPAKSQPIQHMIKDGETIYTLQNVYNVRKTEICFWNGKSPDDFSLTAGKPIKIYLPQAVKHVVKAGETAASITKQYNLVSANQLKYWNKILKTDEVMIGQTLDLYLPTGPTPTKEYESQKKGNYNTEKTFLQSPQTSNTSTSTSIAVPHIVKQGEFLYDIAQIYGVNVKDLKLWNNLQTYYVAPGQQLQIYPSNKKTDNPFVANGNVIKHMVSPNEYLYDIAFLYGVELSDLKEWNNLTNDNIWQGQELVIYRNGYLPPNYQKKNTNPYNNNNYNNGLPQNNTNPYNSNLNRGNTPNNNNTYNSRLGNNDYNSKLGSNNDYNSKLSNNNDYKSAIKPNIGAIGSTVEQKGYAMVVEDIPGAKLFGALHQDAPIGTMIIVKNLANGNTMVVDVVANINPVNSKAGVVIEMTPAAFQRLGAPTNEKMMNVEISYLIEKK